MSSLNKLAIRGIRSFDDKQISVIEFFSPVTVIVGHNGSGKTTIIECLKYATTGDQPPNTRGGAFVHDPKMANEKEVKAQVKLRFHAANGTRMLAVRNLSVTAKKIGLTMKTLESILALDNNADKGAKRAVISTKCAEMDTEIPQLLGVSKAVLENVIFCHQEDSYWPLAEPSILKKKFDEIFEATRYTKALDSIKSLRKERMADLNAEKERLVGLSREKTHADKLKNRIAELKSTIAAKEIDYEKTKNQYDSLVEANQKFYEYANKFREMYMKVQTLVERKGRLELDRDETKLNIQEIPGSDEELEQRLKHFDDHINEQKQQQRLKDSNKQDLEEKLSNVRRHHMELLARQGGLAAEAEAQNRRIAEREQLIHEIGEKFAIKGFQHSPLERDKVLEFMTRLGEAQRKQRTEYERLKSDLAAKTDEYNHKIAALDAELQAHKLQKASLRDQISDRQSALSAADRRLEEQEILVSDLRSLQAEIEEKRSRIEKIRNEIASANFDTRIQEKEKRGKLLQEQMDDLNAESRTLNMHAEIGAKLSVKRTDLKNKTLEIQAIFDGANTKYQKLTGSNLAADSMERDIDRLLLDKEQNQADFENLVTASNSKLQAAETTLTALTTQLNTKQTEVRDLDRRLRAELEEEPLEDAIKSAMNEVDYRRNITETAEGQTTVYGSILSYGKKEKKCRACNRKLLDKELGPFETHVNQLIAEIENASPEKLAFNKEELEDWKNEVDRLQKLRPVQALRDQLKHRDIPSLEKEIQKQEEALPQISKETEEAQERLDILRRQMKDVQALRQQASNISKLQREVDKARSEVASLESDMATGGSTKTLDDVYAELEAVRDELRVNEREKVNSQQEYTRQQNTLRAQENSLHQMELEERDTRTKLQEKEKLEEQMQKYKKDIVTFNNKLKDIDTRIMEAQGPADALKETLQRVQNEFDSKIYHVQDLSQELNRANDKLDHVNKGVERYVKDRRSRDLEHCNTQITEASEEIQNLTEQIENSREIIARIEKEINEGGASVANLRENIRVRRLTKDIIATQEEIDSYDMDEAAKARRNFETKYSVAKEKENELHTAYSHIAGELSSHKSQLESWESDFKEFKDINKKYTDQLIKVKMSDMANSDLEKYAKALDNAIMKYHTLKMEEVNDTMKHLWNKTYQGTDIDGIKIRSDIEGGASKRSYNYRVVMVKDQVEMDMRGRCSAGQKMLASIIIRLALSDSFGQNCGILALDEPTNALDVENIDALAASLVDIINERKSHSNFQLIIITHDENFLRKLGQADVMEYYWRVSRDARQKSLIERQRFR
ncbi:hypothetical protein AMATHDRAFT_852 [Amanita thiersii Skay4041]|uniref:DNA repair protein RAD50 n=1 Tax=Amanita thiersii Skay4041 TaxID=703135 RepID=A0A2A9P0K3_9AGAR|nr:hypothetical protein AMATHDRAFT_852 [Amanita thiersii Skay4041]